MDSRLVYSVAGTATLLLMTAQPALAGPGGKIASAAFETTWGKILLGLLTIIFLPLILLVVINEQLATRRARKDLAFMALRSKHFDWLKLQQRAKDCFQRVHLGWQQGSLSDVSDWMTPWYWQNQQMVYLDNWEKQGLVNVCNVKKIRRVKPLLFLHNNEDGVKHEGSTIILSIEAHMQDFLQHKASGAIVEGSKKWKDVETIWTLVLTDGQWLVADIEESELSLTYAKMRKQLPAIESTLATKLDA